MKSVQKRFKPLIKANKNKVWNTDTTSPMAIMDEEVKARKRAAKRIKKEKAREAKNLG